MNQFKKYLVNNSITSGGLVELGCGNGADAEFAAESGLSPVIAVDIHKSDNIKEARFVHGNYLSDSVFKSVCGILGLHRIKFLHSAFSLCFNKKEKIEEYLPRYFNLLENGGVFFLSDFGDKEEIVVNRTHLLSPWFLTLLNRYFDEVRIEEESVFEPDHAHTHCIFTLIAIKKSSTTIE